MDARRAKPSPPWTFKAHRRAQVRRGLELTAAERLRWLEATLDEMRSLVGRAARPGDVTGPNAD